ncbi:MAG: hypothetical protein IT343_25060 [Candidatus Melainabacteria bacterium]|nr:hypothetical protein [Candidatus Melainabacteria bacterium]
MASATRYEQEAAHKAAEDKIQSTGEQTATETRVGSISCRMRTKEIDAARFCPQE